MIVFATSNFVLNGGSARKPPTDLLWALTWNFERCFQQHFFSSPLQKDHLLPDISTSIHSGWSFSNLFDETASWCHSIPFETTPEMFTLSKHEKNPHTSFETFPFLLGYWGYFTNEWQYAITNPSPDAGLVHQNGDLSPLGQVYVNLGERRLNQVNASETEAMYTEPIFAWEFGKMPAKEIHKPWPCWLHDLPTK